MAKKFIIPAVFLTIAIFGVERVAANDPACASHQVRELGSWSVSQFMAQETALFSWKATVADRYGLLYTLWSASPDRVYACKKKDGLILCEARARPCSLF